MAPETRYARSGDLHIAYQVVGDGPIDLVYVPSWISQVEHYWEEPRVARYFNRIASFSRLIMFDRRGSGLSDPLPGAPTLEEQMDDVVAVMDAAGSERAAVFAQLEGGAMAAMFAATHPERTTALILYEAMARMSWAPDYEWALRPEERAALMESSWGDGSRVIALAPRSSSSARFRAWFAKLERLAASPGTAAQLMGMNGQVDVRAVLPSITVPTLVLHRAEDKMIDIRHSRYLAEHIPGARYLELEGDEVISFDHHSDELIDEIEEFLTGARSAHESERILATVMFSDIVDSTQRAASLGDRRWREELEALEAAIAPELIRYRGRPIKRLGDGLLATFDGPARAIRCALAIGDAARSQFGLEIRSGLHTGEIELIGDDVGGIAVHIGARVIGIAAPGEVLVSGTVKDLVVGSGIGFEPRGERELKGVPGSWRLWSVASQDQTQPAPAASATGAG
jgi:class 3 adenylate cyclase/alpha-beta hydrolase superfamily lysophospholipase